MRERALACMDATNKKRTDTFLIHVSCVQDFRLWLGVTDFAIKRLWEARARSLRCSSRLASFMSNSEEQLEPTH